MILTMSSTAALASDALDLSQPVDAVRPVATCHPRLVLRYTKKKNKLTSAHVHDYPKSEKKQPI